MKTSQEFWAFYQNRLITSLNEVEEKRKERLKYGLILFVVLGLAPLYLWIIFSVFGSSFAKSWDGGIVFFITIITSIFSFLISSQLPAYKAYKRYYKDHVIEPIVKFISSDLQYDATHHISKYDFERSTIFPGRIDNFNGDDYVKGFIDKTAFEFSEVKATRRETSGSGKNRRTKTVTVFQGLFFKADFNKEFFGSTVLVPNYVGRFSFLKKMAGVARPQKYIELEDPELNKLFNCYSTDDVKARYVLSPALMQRIVQFKNKYPKNQVHLSFVNGTLFVAISYLHNLFEAPLFRSAINFKRIESYFDDIRLVVETVEDFNLNTRIWTKE